MYHIVGSHVCEKYEVESENKIWAFYKQEFQNSSHKRLICEFAFVTICDSYDHFKEILFQEGGCNICLKSFSEKGWRILKLKSKNEYQ